MKLSFVKKHIENLRPALQQPEPDYATLFNIDRFIPQQNVPHPNVLTWITHSYIHKTIGGSEYMAHIINKFLIQHGYRIHVIGHWENSEFEGVQLINMWDTVRVQDAIGQSVALVSQNFKYPEFAAKIAGRLQKHLIVFLHTTFPEWDMPPQLYQHHMDTSKLHIIFNTESIKNHFMSPLHSIVVHPPIDLNKIVSNTSRKYVTLITTAEHKGVYQFVQIAKRMPDIQFLGVGNHTESIRLPNITYVPYTKSVQDAYRESDIILMPSESESWGMVASEAISSGIPVIATPTLGLKENMDYAGLYIERNDIDAWVSMIHKLKTDPEFYADTVAKCLKRADELKLQNKTDFEHLKAFVDEITGKN